jgi:LysM repeat protein
MGMERGNCTSGRQYRVRTGDTLYLIARRWGATLAELERLNPGLDPYNLQIGVYVCVPPELPACAAGIYWTIAAGDTFSSIARSVGTTVSTLLALNPTVDPDNLLVGQNICLPGA